MNVDEVHLLKIYIWTSGQVLLKMNASSCSRLYVFYNQLQMWQELLSHNDFVQFVCIPHLDNLWGVKGVCRWMSYPPNSFPICMGTVKSQSEPVIELLVKGRREHRWKQFTYVTERSGPLPQPHLKAGSHKIISFSMFGGP